MPLDGTTMFPDIRVFAGILRDKSRWPKGFKWDFSNCQKCAMGLAHRLWKESVPKPSSFTSHAVGKALGLSEGESTLIFLFGGSTTTPESVADAIDYVLAMREVIP
jgi:hypothetical protein